jgi:hypothetical protein
MAEPKIRMNNTSQSGDVVAVVITIHLEMNPNIGGSPPNERNIMRVLINPFMFLKGVIEFLINVKLEYHKFIKIDTKIKI